MIDWATVLLGVGTNLIATDISGFIKGKLAIR